MGIFFDESDKNDGMKTELHEELLYRRYTYGITDIDEYGCEVTDEERLALFAMKRRIMRKMMEVLDNEIKDCVYEIKTGDILDKSKKR